MVEVAVAAVAAVVVFNIAMAHSCLHLLSRNLAAMTTVTIRVD